MVNDAIILLVAVILDWVLGDPRWLPHPIRWMGLSIEALEPRFRMMPFPLVLSGGLMVILLVTMAYLITSVVIWGALLIHPRLEQIISILLIFYCISIRSLYDEAQGVAKALKQKNMMTARKKVGLIVGRDTDRLDENGVRRAAIETVAENFVDGVVTPLFFAALGGAPLAMAYKMINTLDSMIGYKNERYLNFGKAAARLDDVTNFIPARLSVPVIALGAMLMGRNGRKVIQTAIVEGANHTSPNAGYSEAAFAGALAVRLNGPGTYGGKQVDKPFIGVRFGFPNSGDIARACDLMVVSSIIWLGLLIVFRIAFTQIFLI